MCVRESGGLAPAGFSEWEAERCLFFEADAIAPVPIGETLFVDDAAKGAEVRTEVTGEVGRDPEQHAERSADGHAAGTAHKEARVRDVAGFRAVLRFG